MGDKSGIEWTRGDDGIEGATWNPVTGCDKISPGCGLPLRGSTDPGAGCYALALAGRLKAMGSPKYQADGDPRTSGPGFGVTIHPDTLGQPLRWSRPRRIFVNSMSDLFHTDVPDGFIAQVWDVMGRCPQHTFMILTKRPGRMRSWVRRWADRARDRDNDGPHGMPPMPRGPDAVRAAYSSGRATLFAAMLDSMGTPPPGCAYPSYDWREGQRFWPEVLPNVWLGTSVEDDHWARVRIPVLRQTPAAVRFVSAEPLIGCVDLGFGDPHRHHASGDVYGFPHPRVCLTCSGKDGADEVRWFRREPDAGGIHWVIAGGESGPGARRCEPRWLRMIRDECASAGVPFFCKQLGSVLGRELGAGPKGGGWDAWPPDLRVREFPAAVKAVA